jgi:hypothetical protein
MRTALTSVFAVGFLLCVGSAAYAQTGASLTAGASVTVENQFVCSEDFKVLHEIPISHTVGCETRDCCRLCPGPPDWRLRVDRGATAVFLRFQSLSAKARKNLSIKGNAKWDEKGRLKLGPGETTIRGFRPDSDGLWPMALASIEAAPGDGGPRRAAMRGPGETSRKSADRLPGTEGSSRTFLSIEYFSGSAIVGDRQFSLASRPCKVGSGSGTPPNIRIAVTNDNDSVTVYNSVADGNVPPVQFIRGLNTQLDVPLSIAADGHGRIYVLNEDHGMAQPPAVTVYDASADGDAAPIRRITSPFFADSAVKEIAVDDTGWIFVTADLIFSSNPQIPGAVAVFPPGSNGNTVPTQIITDGTERAFAIAVDRSGSKLFVVNRHTEINLYERSISGFVRTATLSIPSGLTGALAVDARGTLYALSALPERTVFVFEAAANGTLVETRRMTAIGVGVEAAMAVHDWAFHVVDWGPEDRIGQPFEIQTFLVSASGPTSPVSAIRGASTLLVFPLAITVIP